MADHGSRRRPGRRTSAPAVAGTPSSRAAERLESRFAAELGLTRAAWDDALRRSDERWRQNDAAGLVESLEDQRRLLQLLEDRLHTVVSAAAVEREAERIVGAVSAASTAPQTPVPDAEVSRAEVAAGGAAGAGPTERPRSRVRALAGAGAAMAVTMIAVALGATLGLGAPPVPEVAAPVQDTASGAETARARDVGHLVEVADHDAVSSVDPSAGSTNWLQVLRAIDLASVSIDPPAEDSDPRRRTAPDPAQETERPGERETSPATPAGPDRADREADDPAAAERDADPVDDREPDEPDEAEDEDLLDLEDLDDLDRDEETSLPGVELQLP